MLLKVKDMKEGDRFLSHRSGWLTVTRESYVDEVGLWAVDVVDDEGFPQRGFYATGLYRVTRPRHRLAYDKKELSLAECSRPCPRCTPRAYAETDATHKKDIR